MSHFSSEFISFFEELTFNNSSEWFKENKKRYEKHVKAPFYAFVQELILRAKDIDPDINMYPKDCIFRLNRDIRFAKDKTPYKTHIGAIISPGARKDKLMPGFYFQIDKDTIQIYAGGYMLDTKQLKNLRNSIAANPEEFKEVIENPQLVETFGEVQGEKLKRLPKDLMDAAEIEPLIFNKQFFVGATLGKDKITSDELPDLIFEHFLITQEFIMYLRENVN